MQHLTDLLEIQWAGLRASMVFKHNKLPFDYDDSMQLSFQHVRQLNSGSVYESFAHGHIPGKQHFSVLESSDGETVRSGSTRRHFVVEDVQVTTKRARQTEINCPSFHIAHEGSFPSTTAHDEFISRKVAVAFEHSRDSRGSNFNFPWFTFCSREEKQLDQPVRPSSFPAYYEDYCRPVRYNHLEEIHSPVLNYLPQKFVAVGPDHQADVPVYRSKSLKKNCGGDNSDPSTLYLDITADDDDGSDKWIGHCVMQMRDSDLVELEGPTGPRKTDCCCLDEGSIRCLRQHVKEAREQLRISLGHEIFVELGFCDMGEDVASRWTEDEEQLFHEVVLLNSASLGKNFWDVLPLAFPCRSSKEIVSYYFNVFMLRKRAQQNRSDPLHADSDNDEWQESDYVTEDEDDSGVESPPEGVGGYGLGEVDSHEEAEGNDYDDDDDGLHSDADRVTKFGPAADPAASCLRGDSAGEDQDVHDDSCTSYEGQHIDVFEAFRDSIAEEGGHCDPKTWEMGGPIGYMRGYEKDLDLLPTCNVIEEVFGNESWENNSE